MNYQRIVDTASDILRKFNLLSSPVNLTLLTEKLNVSLHIEPLEREISGMLVCKSGKNHIIINSTHPQTRQRFSIAHELGHFHLHHQNNGDNLFVDRQYQIYRRVGSATDSSYKAESSSTTPQQEKEANIFAGALLMPEELIQEYLRKHKIEFLDETKIAKFARAFNVSEQAATIRLMNFDF